MQEQLKEIDSLYTEALKTKDVARIDDHNIDKYNDAYTLYLQASQKIDDLMSVQSNLSDNKKTMFLALKEYYRFEANECKYAFEYKNENFSTSISYATMAKKHINTALKIINDNYTKFDKETQEYFLGLEPTWRLHSLAIQLREIEPNAKMSFNTKSYVEALDLYREMNNIQDKIFEYINTSDLPEVNNRIERGNYYAGKASTANSIAAIYIQKESQSSYVHDILEQFICSSEYIKQAQDYNPEWDKYKYGLETTKENIKKLLENNMDDWVHIYNEFSEKKIIKNTMKEINLDKYKEIELNNALNETSNKAKKLFIYGGFWMSIFIIIMGSIVTLSLLGFNFWIIGIIVFFTQLLYALISSTILRNIGDLSESGLLQIYAMTLKYNFKFMKKNNDD